MKFDLPIYQRTDGSYVVVYQNMPYHVCNTSKQVTLEDVEAYLLDHPDALQPEPLPPEPSAEELRQRELAEKLAYLASTDWYVTRYAETGVAVPSEIADKRQAARARIDELRMV